MLVYDIDFTVALQTEQYDKIQESKSNKLEKLNCKYEYSKSVNFEIVIIS